MTTPDRSSRQLTFIVPVLVFFLLIAATGSLTVVSADDIPLPLPPVAAEASGLIEAAAPGDSSSIPFQSIHPALEHTCGLRPDGTVICWGNIDYGSPSGTFTSISAGAGHNCGIRASAEVDCWGGQNWYGELTPPSGTFTQVSAGYYHVCGIRTDGTLTCWGSNYDGQSEAPDGIYSQVSAGGWHTCALRPDGTVTCWGWNDYNQGSDPEGIYTTISAGGRHACGLKPDSTIGCWGDNGETQGTPPAGIFTSVTAGGYHTCGLRPNGTVECWGMNYYKQLEVPTGVFTSIHAGFYHECALKADGTAVCWGWNESGQATPPIAPPPGTELLMNGSFEVDADNNFVPDNWTRKDTLADARRCNQAGKPPVAYDGNCAYMFKGGTNATARLFQTVNLNGYALQPGDKIKLTGFYHKQSAGTVYVRLFVNYATLPEDQGMVSMTKKTSGYQPIPALAKRLQAVPTRIHVLIQNKTTSGKTYVDGMSLKWVSKSGSGVIPLPPSADNLVPLPSGK